MSKTLNFEPEFSFMEPKSLGDVSLQKFAEVFPDPQDYCIGIIVPAEPLPNPLALKDERVSSLDARIDQELRKSITSKKSESPRWM